MILPMVAVEDKESGPRIFAAQRANALQNRLARGVRLQQLDRRMPPDTIRDQAVIYINGKHAKPGRNEREYLGEVERRAACMRAVLDNERRLPLRQDLLIVPHVA